MSLAAQIPDDLKTSMKAKDKTRTATLRMVLAGIKNLRAAPGHGEDVSDEEVVAIITKEAKSRRESIETYSTNGRPELAAAESEELAILEEYLPEQMGEDEIRAIVTETISQVGAAGPGDKGKVMGALMPKVKGKADGKLVNQIVGESLGS